VTNGAIIVDGGPDIKLTVAELQLLRERIDDDDERLSETAGALDEVGAGHDVTLPEAEREHLCELLDKVVMSVSPRKLSSLPGIVALRGIVCFS
jgi:hypothetical protein